MPSLMMKKCCGCMELKTGCFIIGCINLVGCLFINMFGVISLVESVELIIHAYNKKEDINIPVGITIVAAIVLIFQLLALAFVFVLLIGLQKDKAGYLKAYLASNVIFIVVLLIKFSNDIVSGTDTIGATLLTFLFIGLNMYFFIVIRSYIKELSRITA